MTELRDLIARVDFFWLDVPVADNTIRAEVLAQLALDPSDLSWALRFGQALRVVIDRRGVRVVTWLAAREGDVAEVHVLCSGRYVVSVWSGDAAALDDAARYSSGVAVDQVCRDLTAPILPACPRARR